MPKLSSFGPGKTIWPKKSLTSLLHAALQLVDGSCFIGSIWFDCISIITYNHHMHCDYRISWYNCQAKPHSLSSYLHVAQFSSSFSYSSSYENYTTKTIILLLTSGSINIAEYLP